MTAAVRKTTDALFSDVAPFAIRTERASDVAAREILLDACFGEDRHTRTCQRLRDGRAPAEGLAFSAVHLGKLVGTVRLWHVSNELGCHIGKCWCDVSAAAFRRWLCTRYGSIDALNDAWGMAFWGNSYSSFEEVTTPSGATAHNPGQLLDYERFSSDELLEQYRAERAVLLRHTPELPVTTNFMMSSATKGMDYFRWAPEVDVVANDHYTIASDAARHVELA